MKDIKHSVSPQLYARTAGILLLISIMAGGFGEIFVLTKLIVPGNATATVNNLHASQPLFRLGFASYLVEAVCDISLVMIFYRLLKPVQKDIALLTVFFGLLSTATFAFAELFYFGVTQMISGAEYLNSFSSDQLNTVTMLFLKLYGLGGGAFMVFYGVASILRGFLIYQSGYIPKFLGAFLLLGGLGFVIRNFVLVIAPAYASDFLLIPTALASILLAFWLVVKGVNATVWNQKANLS